MSLMRDGLWGIVSKNEAEPEAGTERHTKFVTRRDRALATIVLSVDPSLLYLLGDPTDPAAIIMGEAVVAIPKENVGEQTSAKETATLNATQRRTQRAGTCQEHDRAFQRACNRRRQHQ